MPKKNKLKEKKTEEDLEKEWNKLRKKIKINLKKSKNKEKPKEEAKEKKEQESKKEEAEESELEEGIEESERVLEESEFHEFIPSFPISSEGFVPVLQRVERPQQQETLEENLASTPVATQTTQDKTDDMMKYSMSEDYASEEKRKYQESAVVLRNIETAREFRKLPKQELLNPPDWIMTNPWDVERGEKIDTEFIREEAKLPFEKKDKKYKEFKL